MLCGLNWIAKSGFNQTLSLFLKANKFQWMKSLFSKAKSPSPRYHQAMGKA